MTPADLGYVQCQRCGTWLRPEWVIAPSEMLAICADVAWCSRAAGVGKGALEVEPKPEGDK